MGKMGPEVDADAVTAGLLEARRGIAETNVGAADTDRVSDEVDVDVAELGDIIVLVDMSKLLLIVVEELDSVDMEVMEVEDSVAAAAAIMLVLVLDSILEMAEATSMLVVIVELLYGGAIALEAAAIDATTVCIVVAAGGGAIVLMPVIMIGKAAGPHMH